MATKSTPRSTKTTRPARRTPAKAEVKQGATSVKRQISETLGNARETTNRRMLASLGLTERLRRQREERFAEWVAEGKRVQPKLDKAIENLKEKLRPAFHGKVELSKFRDHLAKLTPDLSKFKIDTSGFSRKAIEQKFEARMAEGLHRIGLPTRKEVQTLARKVDKLVVAQEA